MSIWPIGLLHCAPPPYPQNVDKKTYFFNPSLSYYNTVSRTGQVNQVRHSGTGQDEFPP